MFRDREDAACRLAEELKGRVLLDPLVLAIPCGGVVMGAVLARELGAELVEVLARKLRAPGRPDLALGAVNEDGRVRLNDRARANLEGTIDLFNLLNANHVLGQVTTLGSTWGRPNRILTPRIIRFGITARF